VDLTWHDRRFDELDVAALYAILELRALVFVVEQACAYNDIDGHDRIARHLYAEANGIAAYLRILPAGTKYDETSIGRVVVAPAYRGTGLGKELMQRGIAAAGAGPIRIGAQAHLERFYGELGFQRVSEPYVEDGIPHVEMIRPAGS